MGPASTPAARAEPHHDPSPPPRHRPAPARRRGPGRVRLRDLRLLLALALRPPRRPAAGRRPSHGGGACESNPGLESTPGGTANPNRGFNRGGPPTIIAPETYGELIDSSGAVVTDIALSSSSSQPALPATMPDVGPDGTFFTVGSVNGSGDWRVYLRPAERTPQRPRAGGGAPDRGDRLARPPGAHRDRRPPSGCSPCWASARGSSCAAGCGRSSRWPPRRAIDHRRRPVRNGCRRPTAAPRSASSAWPSTPCWTRSRWRSASARRPSSGCASSWPTPPTSCARRSPRSRGSPSCSGSRASSDHVEPRDHPAPHRGGVGPHEGAGRGPAAAGPPRRDPSGRPGAGRPGRAGRRRLQRRGGARPDRGRSRSTPPTRSSSRAIRTTCARPSPTWSPTRCTTRRRARPSRSAPAMADGYAVVTVRDHGPGLDADALAHVFDRFWQADDARVGSGRRPRPGHRGRHRRRARRGRVRHQRRPAAAPRSGCASPSTPPRM